MDQIILFDKSKQQRLEEYNQVFSGDEVISSSALEKAWAFFLEITVDRIGWQSIWKIPRLTCEQLGVSFPSVVLVLVLDIDFNELEALVRILAVQDDISIPEKHFVPLTQLWPTKQQDDSVVLNLDSTANALDMYRFFYLHIYMPWDTEEDDSVDWRNKHLETRLALYYDLKNGIVPRATAEHIHSLLSKAKKLSNKRDYYERLLSDQESIEYEHDRLRDENVESLAEVNLRLWRIKTDIDLVENPLLREAFIREQAELVRTKLNSPQQIWLIFQEGCVDDYLNFLKKVKHFYPTEKLMFATSLAFKLESCNANDKFILNESKHVINTTGALEMGGELKGVGNRDEIVVKSSIEEVMLDFIGGTVLLENLTLDASGSQLALLVRKGKGVLKNCKIIGNLKSSTQQGIITLNEAELELINCEITGFSTAIIGNSGSKISLSNCDVHGVGNGVKIFDRCLFNATNTKIHDCGEYGVTVNTENNLDGCERKVGSFDSLSVIPDVSTESVSGRNNAKGDVVINPKCKLSPIENLFSDPDLDPTMIQSSDDENCDTTVIPFKSPEPME